MFLFYLKSRLIKLFFPTRINVDGYCNTLILVIMFKPFDLLFSFKWNLTFLQGVKWITNKWIRHYAQFNNFPCSANLNYGLNRQEPFPNPWIKE